jgi:DNA (cytosine-5)-methyltransferase 1
MRYLSVCSGIEAATVAWHSLGWQPVAFSEIEPFPSAVLAHHYPNVPNLGDMTKFKEWDIGTIDLLVGGTPCQSFSVAGLRKGLEDPRGNLALVYCGILDRFKPKWFVWENVPGVLSSSGGRDFGSFLGAVAELGYGFAYRVLDAQYFGVAQRRRRVFVVGCLGDWRSAAEVLFEPESLCGDSAPSREKGQEVAKCLTRGAAQRLDAETETMIAIALAENTIGRQPENGGNGDGFTVGGPMYTLNATGVHGVAQPIAFEPGKLKRLGYGYAPAGLAPTLRAGAGDNQLAIAQPTVLMDQGGSVMSVLQDGTVGTLRRETHGHEPVVMQQMAVRRLTPVECERLQGFPDNYTNIAWRKQPESPDGPRYKALGNSMAVPVMKWIGEQINGS